MIQLLGLSPQTQKRGPLVVYDEPVGRPSAARAGAVAAVLAAELIPGQQAIVTTATLTAVLVANKRIGAQELISTAPLTMEELGPHNPNFNDVPPEQRLHARLDYWEALDGQFLSVEGYREGWGADSPALRAVPENRKNSVMFGAEFQLVIQAFEGRVQTLDDIKQEAAVRRGALAAAKAIDRAMPFLPVNPLARAAYQELVRLGDEKLAKQNSTKRVQAAIQLITGLAKDQHPELIQGIQSKKPSEMARALVEAVKVDGRSRPWPRAAGRYMSNFPGMDPGNSYLLRLEPLDKEGSPDWEQWTHPPKTPTGQTMVMFGENGQIFTKATVNFINALDRLVSSRPSDSSQRSKDIERLMNNLRPEDADNPQRKLVFIRETFPDSNISNTVSQEELEGPFRAALVFRQAPLLALVVGYP
jgi:hypothetical protein